MLHTLEGINLGYLHFPSRSALSPFFGQRFHLDAILKMKCLTAILLGTAAPALVAAAVDLTDYVYPNVSHTLSVVILMIQID